MVRWRGTATSGEEIATIERVRLSGLGFVGLRIEGIACGCRLGHCPPQNSRRQCIETDGKQRLVEGATIITVTQAHCDELGHLNHVEAVRYLERARGEWYRRCGLYDGAGGQSLGTVVVNIDYNYRAECFVGERLRITTRPISMGTRSFTLEHAIIKPDGRTAIDGKCTSVVMDLAERSIIPVPQCLAVHLPKHA